jgi:hypothetical protein
VLKFHGLIYLVVESILDTDCACHDRLRDVTCTCIIVYVVKLLLFANLKTVTGMFLEVLEPYILKDMLGSLPPEVSSMSLLVLAHHSIHELMNMIYFICRLCKL